MSLCSCQLKSLKALGTMMLSEDFLKIMLVRVLKSEAEGHSDSHFCKLQRSSWDA